LVNGTERSFNPLHFALMPEGLRALERRDAWMRAPFPFFRERAVPLAQTSQLDLERCEYQQVFMDSYNRVLGGLDGIWQGDPEAGTQHLLDALFVLMHYGAEIEAKRRAEERHSDVLLRRRKEVSRAIGTSFIDEQMFALAKKEQIRAEFFRKAGSSSTPLPGPQGSAATLLNTATLQPTLPQPTTPYPSTFPPIPSTTTTPLPTFNQPQTQTPQVYFDPNTNFSVSLSVLPVGGTAAVPLCTSQLRSSQEKQQPPVLPGGRLAGEHLRGEGDLPGVWPGPGQGLLPDPTPGIPTNTSPDLSPAFWPREGPRKPLEGSRAWNRVPACSSI
jgi:hypothetical protein